MSLCHIVWISEAIKKYSEDELLALLTKSRTNNVRLGVTGLLLYHQGSFMQFMEGEEDIVLAIYHNRIVPSRLHREVTLLLKMERTERVFANWTMGFMATDSKLANTVPGFTEFVRTKSSFMELAGDGKHLNKIIDGFHAGRWHLHTDEI
jgi:hypothetical protein